MAFKMKGYGGFHGKKKPTLFKNVEISTGFEDFQRDPTIEEIKAAEDMPFPQQRQDYDGGGLSIDYDEGNTTDNEFGTDWTSAPKYTVDKEWQKRSGIKPKKGALQDIKDGKYPKGWKNMSDQEKMDTIFDANMAQAMFHADTNQQKDLTITGGRSFKPTGQGAGRYIKSEDKFEPRWSSTGYSMPNPQTGGEIDYGPNMNEILREEGLATWKDVGEGNVEADFSEYLKRRSEGVIPLKVPEVEVSGEREGRVSVGKITGGEVVPEKTGKIPWDKAPKVDTEARKKFYDKYNLRYDDTIKGFNRDGSRSEPQPVRRDEGNVKKKKKSKGLNLDLSQINFSDWDRPIREFFGQ